jgi:beta-glucosidase-like glycosyl hydrolase
MCAVMLLLIMGSAECLTKYRVAFLLLQAASGKGIMCSYNAVNGEPSCASSSLLRGLLRNGLGFDGE